MSALFAIEAATAQPRSPLPRPSTAPVLQASAATPARLVDLIDVDEHDTQVDITLQFNCSLHYAGHAPASEGPEVRLRLRLDRDCNGAGGYAASEVASEIPPISGPRGILTAARLEASLGGEVTLTLTWAKPESFVLAQGASARGLRIRLLRAHQEKPRILVTDRGDTASNFAVNLESQRTPFDPGAATLAAQRLQIRTFVSETENGGEKWYRLRAGPFDQRSVAESVLRAAAKDYPRAWLAVGDDSVTTDPFAAVAEPPLPAVEPMGTDPALDGATRAELLAEARRMMSAHEYATAVQILTKLQRQPEFPQRAEAQELLGLARERAGQVAQAKAEYEEYLHRYPQGAAAERVRERLRLLRAAAAAARTGGIGGSEPADRGWQASGGVSQLLRRDSFGTDLNGPLFSTLVQNAVFTDADLFLHRDGERLATAFRTSFGYVKNLLPDDIAGANNRARITTAFFDLNDRVSGLRGRLGRQTLTTDGVFGIFDGAALAYQFAPAWSVRGTVGMPVENAGDGIRTERRFETVALDFAPALGHWDTSLYLSSQSFDGIRDRQAVGTQVQYARPTASLVGYVDYDTGFHSLNALAVLGSVQLPDRWQLTADLERRNAPLLTTGNALIGQTVSSLTELERTYSEMQLFQLARDRTPAVSSYVLSAIKQLGERFQVIFDVFDTTLGDTPASGGVEAFPGSDGRDLAYQVQILGSSLLRSGDFNQWIVREDRTASGRTLGSQFISRYPLFGAWRFGPRVLVQRTQSNAGLTQNLYAPYGHLDYQRNGRVLEIEAGAEFGRNPAELQIGNSTRLFVSIGYRINF